MIYGKWRFWIPELDCCSGAEKHKHAERNAVKRPRTLVFGIGRRQQRYSKMACLDWCANFYTKIFVATQREALRQEACLFALCSHTRRHGATRRQHSWYPTLRRRHLRPLP